LRYADHKFLAAAKELEKPAAVGAQSAQLAIKPMVCFIFRRRHTFQV
jgi:hypothetical protein